MLPCVQHHSSVRRARKASKRNACIKTPKTAFHIELGHLRPPHTTHFLCVVVGTPTCDILCRQVLKNAHPLAGHGSTPRPVCAGALRTRTSYSCDGNFTGT